MRQLIVYRHPREIETKDEFRRYSNRDSYDRAYYDDDRYYDYEKYRKSPSDYYEEEYEYEDRQPYYRYRNTDRYEYARGRKASFVLPNEDTADLIMNGTAFGDYIARHGYHFTAQLADCASKMLVNANKREHRWTSDLVRQLLAMHGINDIGSCTLGDITFLANMAYADFYPEVLTSEHACIKYAVAMAKDPDGYDGIVFSRWIADLIGKRITTIDWEKYI